MSRRRKTYTSPNLLNSKGTKIVLTRELHPEVLPHHTAVIKFIASLHIPGIDPLPTDEATHVTLLRSDTVRNFYLQRLQSTSIIDTNDLLDLEYQLNKTLGAEAPSAKVQDDFGPLRVDDSDRLVVDLKDSNELQIDRCRILSGLSEVLQLKRFSPKDIDDLLDPVDPVIPIATVDRRILGKDFEHLVYDPVQYLHDEALVRLDVTPLPVDTYIPTALPLGNLGVRAVTMQPDTTSYLEEHFPDVEFDERNIIKDRIEYA